MRTWWYRNGNTHEGLNQSIEFLEGIWNGEESGIEGILGFSRGARLTHLIAHIHHTSKGERFPNLKYVIIASGYGDVPMPDNFSHGHDDVHLSIPSLHIYGKKDRLVPPSSSRALLNSYIDPIVHEHEGGHYIPMRSDNVSRIMSFIMDHGSKNCLSNHQASIQQDTNHTNTLSIPDEEHAQIQRDECESLSMIFPDEFQLLSPTNGVESKEFGESNIKYKFPISYAIQLSPSREKIDEDPSIASLWPIKPIGLKVTYTPTYPDTSPLLDLFHDMNLLELKLSQSKACLEAIQETAKQELGMPCIMSCVYQARDFFENGGLASSLTNGAIGELNDEAEDALKSDGCEIESEDDKERNYSAIKPSTKQRIEECIQEGLQIAYSMLARKTVSEDFQNISVEELNSGKGGSWRYTIGLVGKPSAGKSTFFNAATGFARQRGGDDINEEGVAIGGAAMAPHPFTTIDPNVGYCLVPAPKGSCPEDSISSDAGNISCTHGRDSQNRRLIPVMLKDVAGLVPGAYKGRGKGNAFLNDLTDADVLIHVLDSSGSADAEGNTVFIDGTDLEECGASNPIDDLGWVFNELIQWVYSNLHNKWESVRRRGRNKLAAMFSGYKQSKSFVWDVILTIEKHLLKRYGRKNTLDHLEEWDEGDLYRLVAAFLGSRFPVALALNKQDLPSAQRHSKVILNSLPCHGAHVAVAMSAYEEMKYVRNYICADIFRDHKSNNEAHESAPPHNVLDCLQSAIMLREPVLAFPVADMETYAPLVGLDGYATGDASLPSAGMIACLKASGGRAPSLWQESSNKYSITKNMSLRLRDVLTMKPGSTIEDVYFALKWYGAVSGEFVRAEAACNIGDKPKPVRKDDLIGRHNRIIKIMTTRRREWQKNK